MTFDLWTMVLLMSTFVAYLAIGFMVAIVEQLASRAPTKNPEITVWLWPFAVIVLSVSAIGRAVGIFDAFVAAAILSLTRKEKS
jgi:hypothetical protein